MTKAKTDCFAYKPGQQKPPRRKAECTALDKHSMDEGIGNIEFYDGMWYVDGEPNNSLYDIVECDDVAEVEVIGNTLDNPELLKGE